MQYMVMCCFDENAYNNIPDAQKDKIMRDYGDLGNEPSQHRPLPRRGKTPPGGISDDCAREKRQGRIHKGDIVLLDGPYRWTFRRDKRATRRLPPYRLHGSERGDVDRGTGPDASCGGTVEVRCIAELEC